VIRRVASRAIVMTEKMHVIGDILYGVIGLAGILPTGLVSAEVS